MTSTQASTLSAYSPPALEIAVLETIVYSDLFDFPLTCEEVWRWLPLAATLTDVDETLRGDKLASVLVRRDDYVMLRGREELAVTRSERGRSTVVLRKKAERCGRMISYLPFVRLVAITGSIAAENAAVGSDLDYMVITAPGRVWTVRAMTMLLARLYRLPGYTICPNYLLSESAMALEERDRYTARELLQMIPIGRSQTYSEMLGANDWWRDYLPNATPRRQSQSRSASRVRNGVEAVLRWGVFDGMEGWLMRRKVAELRGQATTSEAVFNADMCKGHFESWRARTESAVAERMKALLESQG